jgi:hypothetical protein
MTPRNTRETLDSLRVTLQKLEQTADSVSNGQDVAELKQILLNRIAELETLNALQLAESEPVPAPSDLPHLAAVTEENSVQEQETGQTPSLEKLD